MCNKLKIYLTWFCIYMDKVGNRLITLMCVPSCCRGQTVFSSLISDVLQEFSATTWRS